MNLRRCESPGDIARIAALSADQAPTAIIGCPHMESGHSVKPPECRQCAISGLQKHLGPSDNGNPSRFSIQTAGEIRNRTKDNNDHV
jgi:hypothetical protein